MKSTLPPHGDGICSNCKEFAMLYRLNLCFSCTKKLGTTSACVANRLVEEISKGPLDLQRFGSAIQNSHFERRTA